MIDDDVLDIVACMLTAEARTMNKFPRVWFMPTIFAQNVHNWSMKPTNFTEVYGTQFMGTGVSLEKIYIPMNEDNIHWFLIMVGLPHREIILLDSLPCLKKLNLD